METWIDLFNLALVSKIVRKKCQMTPRELESILVLILSRIFEFSYQLNTQSESETDMEGHIYQTVNEVCKSKRTTCVVAGIRAVPSFSYFNSKAKIVDVTIDLSHKVSDKEATRILKAIVSNHQDLRAATLYSKTGNEKAITVLGNVMRNPWLWKIDALGQLRLHLTVGNLYLDLKQLDEASSIFRDCNKQMEKSANPPPS